MVRRNDNDGNENNESYSLSQISESITAAINIPSTFSSKDIANLYQHISFKIMIEKSLLYSHLAIISSKILPISYIFEYLKSL